MFGLWKPNEPFLQRKLKGTERPPYETWPMASKRQLEIYIKYGVKRFVGY